MSKAIYLSVISGRFIRYEDIPATSHTPQLLASNCFLSEKGDSKAGCEFLNLKFHRLIGNKHDTIYTEYEFSLDGKWSTLNLSTSSFLKFNYQLSSYNYRDYLQPVPWFFYTLIRLLSLQEQTVLFGKRWEKVYSYRFTLFFIWGIFIGDEGGN